MEKVILKYELLPYGIEPTRATDLSSGLDIYSPNKYIILPHKSIKVYTGIKFEIPAGYDLSVYNRSSIASKKKLIKGAELIDNDYRGELIINLINVGSVPTTINKGEKIAQVVLRPVIIPELKKVKKVKENTQRGSGGFGSSDKVMIDKEVIK